MTDDKNGGPAFPMAQHTKDVTGQREMVVFQQGMTLRDYFAGQALAVATLMVAADAFQGKPSPDAPDLAEGAYQIADAMLAERSK